MITIFMAEDDPLMSRMYERVFRLNGYTLEMAFDGEEALLKLQKMAEKPTIILLDIMMPKMSGFEVLKKIKEDAAFENIPVIMLTNLAGQADAEKALGMGAVLYLVKSQYNPKEVVDKIKEIIAGTARGDSTPQVKVAVKDIPAKE